jgi:hypothetical protein
MNKVYKNYDELLKEVFPNYYIEKKYHADESLESYIKRTSKDFKLKIDNIIKDRERPGGA